MSRMDGSEETLEPSPGELIIDKEDEDTNKDVFNSDFKKDEVEYHLGESETSVSRDVVQDSEEDVNCVNDSSNLNGITSSSEIEQKNEDCDSRKDFIDGKDSSLIETDNKMNEESCLPKEDEVSLRNSNTEEDASKNQDSSHLVSPQNMISEIEITEKVDTTVNCTEGVPHSDIIRNGHLDPHDKLSDGKSKNNIDVEVSQKYSSACAEISEGDSIHQGEDHSSIQTSVKHSSQGETNLSSTSGPSTFSPDPSERSQSVLLSVSEGYNVVRQEEQARGKSPNNTSESHSVDRKTDNKSLSVLTLKDLALTLDGNNGSPSDSSSGISVTSSSAVRADNDAQQDGSSDASDAEDALLTELDAALEGELTPEEEGRPDPVNGLTKESVIEGLVEFQKLKNEFEQMKRSLKSKSVELERMRGENTSLKEQLHDLAELKDREIRSSDSHKDVALKAHQFKIRELQVVIEQHKEDYHKLRERQVAHDGAAKKVISQLQQEMIVRVGQVKGMYEDALKEKENMVMKYAKSEKEVLDLKKVKEGLERKVREQHHVVETANAQSKQLRKEMLRIKEQSGSKETEVSGLQTQVDQMKEEVSSQVIKVKWAQNKLKAELDSHKETKVKFSKLEKRLAEAKEETELIRKNCQEIIKQYQESEEVKSNSLGIELKKKEQELKIKKQETSDHLEVNQQRLKELNSLKQAHEDATAELESLRVRVKCLEEERIQQEEVLTKFKGLLNNQKDVNRFLAKEHEEAKKVHSKLEEAQGKIKQLEQQLINQREEHCDLQTEIESTREKETELLQFTEKISSKNAALHAEIANLQVKVDSLTEENAKLSEQLEESQHTCSQTSTELRREKEFRHRESVLLTTRLGEKSKTVEDLTTKLDEAKDEAKTLKRRHAANVKDLTRQFQQSKKRLETLERERRQNKDNQSMGSRTSSSGSLETAGVTTQGGTSGSNSGRGSISGTISEEKQSPAQSPQVSIASGNNDFPGIDKGMLVERIIRLQRMQQKNKEKVEFQQEHNRTLVEVIQKKSKIIQQYVMREESGALSSAASDINKVQMSKQSGIMASLYKSQASDPRMTLDLSLQINQKLQAVLEDTLLKNITLKENIDTLGREIARLSEDLFNTKELIKATRT